MKIKANLSQILGIAFVSLFLLPVIPVNAQNPVIDIDELTDSFTPTTWDEDSYYVVDPDETFTGVKYYGDVSTLVESTDAYQDFIGEDTSSFDNDQSVGSNQLMCDYRYGNSPFFPYEVMPKIVVVDNPDSYYLEKSEKIPFSIHKDRKFTFHAEGGIFYNGLYNSTDPFLLDIHIHDSSGSAYINFGSAVPSYYDLDRENSIPVYPLDGTEMQNFTLHFSKTTLVSITPHALNIETNRHTIPVNTTYSGSIEQGGYYEVESGCFKPSRFDIFSIIYFDFPIIEGEYYNIYLDINSFDIFRLTESSVNRFFLGKNDNFEEISSLLNENGYMLKALKDATITLVFYPIGPIFEDYTIYFQKTASPVEEEVELLLPLNQNTTLKEDTYYYFTLEDPSIMAVNWTSSYDFDLYQEDEEVDWLYVTADNYFSPETGNLYGDYLDDFGKNWRYVPAGSYAIRATSVPTFGEIFFTVIPVSELSASSTLTVNQNSLFAFELDSLTMNRINYLNLSTDDHVNQTITYEYAIIGKYNEFYTSSSNDLELGNWQTNDIWNGNPTNKSTIARFLPSRPKQIPIMILRPYSCYNGTDYLDSFSGTLITAVGTTPNQHIDYSVSYYGWGDFIPTNQVTDTGSFAINDDKTTDDDQIFGIPLVTDINCIYNVTARIYGNYTNTWGYNASFYTYYIHSGNFRNVIIFNDYSSIQTAYVNAINFHMLALTSTSYLYITVDRYFDWNIWEYLNGTLEVTLEKISISSMTFDVPDIGNYLWNGTISAGEVINQNTLLENLSPQPIVPYTSTEEQAPGFELLAAVVSLGAIAIGSKIKKKRH